MVAVPGSGSRRPARRTGLLGFAVSASVLVAACHRRDPDPAPEPRLGDAPAFLVHYADVAFAEYSDAVDGARTLATAVETFVHQPTPDHLAGARAAWLRARVPYLQTETFRFYGGPIDAVETLVNTWPVDENAIEGSGDARGIIDDAAAFPVLTEDTLVARNMKDGETSVTTGFHAIEFLLWGADRNDAGPGTRPATDFSDGSAPARRRGEYLVLATRLLVKHLERVRADWEGGKSDNYRGRFLARPAREALSLVVKGMGTLTGPELSGERLTVPYETKDQENEHSCFSDNTHEDVALDATGVRNLCTGTYVRPDGSRVSGPGLCALVAQTDPALAAQLTRETEASVAAARAIPPPFDHAILGPDSAPGRVAVKQVIVALSAQARTLGRVAGALGATLPPTARP